MTDDLLRRLVAASLASPSVHNVQPARWRIEREGRHGALVLLEDTTRRLAVGDPRGRDASMSLGAAAEGVAIAATGEGLSTRIERLSGNGKGRLHPIARLTFKARAKPDPLLEVLPDRASWRGAFEPPTLADRNNAAVLAGEDRKIVTETRLIADIAGRYDAASFAIMEDQPFRAELTHWMRLRSRHPDWARDGLNAAAMQLSAIEALAAGAVLGPLFRPLAAIGLAPALLAEAKGFANAAGVALFHRPLGEDPFDSGRAFHRLWLEIDAAGFGANVLAALADHPPTAAALTRDYELPEDHRLVSAFRIGLRSGPAFARARLPLDEVLLD